MSLWIDADPSGLTWTGLDCDDDLALLMVLALSSSNANGGHDSDQIDQIDLQGISICGGNAPLSHTTPDARLLLNHVAPNFTPSNWHLSDIPKGIGWNDMNVAWKSLRLFHWLSPDVSSSNDAAKAIIDAAEQSTSAPLTVLMLGPPSNLAKAIESSPSLPGKLDHVVLMGGELTQQRMDLNFMSDRAAARSIIESNVPTTIVPIQTCGQAVVTNELIGNFEDKCCPRAAACALLPKMRQQVRMMPTLVNKVVEKRFASSSKEERRWRPSPNLQKGFIPWDVIALLATVRPNMFDEWEWHEASTPSCAEEEPCSGNMIVGQGQADEPITFQGWVKIPHVIRNETELLETAFLDLACSVDARTTAHPPLFWGFLVHAAICFGSLLVIATGMASLALRLQRRMMHRRRIAKNKTKIK